MLVGWLNLLRHHLLGMKVGWLYSLKSGSSGEQCGGLSSFGLIKHQGRDTDNVAFDR